MGLKKFEQNIQSQFGEDGVIQEIFTRIGTINKICVEFGSWDGINLSNTWNLWHEQGWEALLIEGDKKKHKVLTNTVKAFEKVLPVNAYVTAAGDNSLDNILIKYKFPKEIDLLSIDIDGDDYYIFESLSYCSPKVVIIEYNPTIPPHVEIIQEKGEYFGASAKSILKLAHKKGYKLTHMTETNMFFVTNKSFDRLGFDEPILEEVFVNKHLVYVISSYDGKTFAVGNPPYVNFKNIKSQHSYPAIINPLNVTIEKTVIYKI